MKIKKYSILSTISLGFFFLLFYIGTDTITLMSDKSIKDKQLVSNQNSSEPLVKSTVKKENHDLSENASKLDQIHVSAYFKQTYNSIEELINVAEIIIEGEVLETSSFEHNRSIYTKSLIKVTKSYNQNVMLGDNITFVEIGGITTKGEISKNTFGKVKVKKEDLDTPVEVVFNKMPVMKKKEKVLIFGVSPASNDLLPEKYFFPVGSYQGKFNINQGIVKRFVPKEEVDIYNSLEISQKELNVILEGKNN